VNYGYSPEGPPGNGKRYWTKAIS